MMERTGKTDWNMDMATMHHASELPAYLSYRSSKTNVGQRGLDGRRSDGLTHDVVEHDQLKNRDQHIRTAREGGNIRLTTICTEDRPIIRLPTIGTQPLMFGVSVALIQASAQFPQHTAVDIPRPHERDGEHDRSPYRQLYPRLGRAAVWRIRSTPPQIDVRVDPENKLGHGNVRIVNKMVVDRGVRLPPG